MTTHTPGPWIWLQDSEDSGKADCGCELFQSHQGSHAAFFLCRAHDAAPDLLAACQAALSLFTDDPVYGTRCRDCGVHSYNFHNGAHAEGCIVPELEAAIAKACPTPVPGVPGTGATGG